MLRATGVLLLVGVVFAIACGDGGKEDRLAEEEYFERLRRGMDEWVQTVNDLVMELSSSDGSDDEAWAMLLEVYRTSSQEFERLIDGYRELAPPSEYADLHERLLETGDALAVAVREWTEGLPESGDVYDIPNQDDLDAETAAFETTCEDLAAASSGSFECLISGMPGQCITLGSAESNECNTADTIDIAAGIRGRLVEVPPLPEGLVAASSYIEFEVDDGSTAATIGLPLDEPASDASGLGWYSYVDGEWDRLEVAVRLEEDGQVASGDFESVPPSLVVLREE